MTRLEGGIVINLVCGVIALSLLHLFPSDQGLTVTIASKTRYLPTRLVLSGTLIVVSSGLTIVLVVGYASKLWRSLSV